jgi:hypothetical protein
MKKVSSLAVDFREKDDGDEYWNNVCVDEDVVILIRFSPFCRKRRFVC